MVCAGNQPVFRDRYSHVCGAGRTSSRATFPRLLASSRSRSLMLVGVDHEYLKLELPALGNRLDKVLAVHGARDPETLSRMAEVFVALRGEMEMHMHKEEAILFPFIEKYSLSESQGSPMPPVPFGSIANPIAMMEREHVSAGGALVE